MKMLLRCIYKAYILLLFIIIRNAHCYDINERTIEIPIEFKSIEQNTNEYSQSSSYQLRQLYEMNFDLNQLSLPSMKIHIGTPGEDIEVSLTSLQAMVFIGGRVFQSCNSKTFVSNNQLISLPFINFHCQGALSRDTITLNNQLTMQSFPFIYINNELHDYTYQGTIGFSYLDPVNGEIKNISNYSFLTQLKANGHIDNEIVSIGYRNNNPVLVLGNYPKDEWLNDKKRYKTCRLIDQTECGDFNPNWECELDSVYMNDNYFYKVKKRAVFSIGGDIISVSEKFFDEMVERYFIRDIELKVCKIVDTGRHKMLQCLNHYINGLLTEISFVIGKWNIKLNKENIFQRLPNNRNITFNLMVKLENKEQWTIPFSLFKDMFFIFDKETKTMGLLSTNSNGNGRK